jgi:hypothetical protein
LAAQSHADQFLPFLAQDKVTLLGLGPPLLAERREPLIDCFNQAQLTSGARLSDCAYFVDQCIASD